MFVCLVAGFLQVMGEIQAAMNSKDIVSLGRALKEAERLNIDEVTQQSLIIIM